MPDDIRTKIKVQKSKKKSLKNVTITKLLYIPIGIRLDIVTGMIEMYI